MSTSRSRSKKTRILYVEGQEIFHDCMRHLFSNQEDMHVIAAASNGRTAVRLAKEHTPDVVIMDPMLPALNGIDATRQIIAENPSIRVVGLSVISDGKRVVEMFRAGAQGYVLKDCAFAELVQAVRTVMDGKMYLSPSVTQIVLEDVLRLTQEGKPSALTLLTQREREVLQLVVEGKSNREIAEALHLGQRTVETHRANIMRKLNLSNVVDMVKFAIREGLIEL